MYLLFMQHVLHLLNKINVIFQSDHVNITMYSELSTGYKSILAMYLSNDYVKATPAKLIEPSLAERFLPLHKVYLGPKATILLLKPEIAQDKPQLMMTIERCQQFLVKLCEEMKARLPLENNALEGSLTFLKPDVALTSDIPTLIPYVEKFPHTYTELDAAKIEEEWQLFKLCPNVQALQDEVLTCEGFWSKIANLNDSSGNLKFSALASFAKTLLSLPISNASVERIFSAMNLIKVNRRNRISSQTLANLIMTKEFVAESGSCCDFVPTASMYNCFNSSMYETNQESD